MIPTEKSIRLSQLFEGLNELLLCKECQIHYRQFWKALPLLSPSRREHVLCWLLFLYNNIQVRLRRPTLTLHQVWNRQYSQRLHPTPTSPRNRELGMAAASRMTEQQRAEAPEPTILNGLTLALNQETLVIVIAPILAVLFFMVAWLQIRWIGAEEPQLAVE